MHNLVLEGSQVASGGAKGMLHVAIICDGNGRWGTAHGQTRHEGHRAGAEAARRVIECASYLGIHTLTLFALSSANWRRPAEEVAGILHILQEYLREETEYCVERAIRLTVIGRRDRLPSALREAIGEAEARTANGKRLYVRLAVDYSARQTLYQAASKFYKVKHLSSEEFANLISEVQRGGPTEVDLLIRTGGEKRLSDFLLWECAFAEFVFLEKKWPDFTPADLRDAVLEFEKRERTCGRLSEDYLSTCEGGRA